MLLAKDIEGFFDKKVLELCKKELCENRKLGLAVSGGADSVFVLLAFIDIFKAENLQVLHFNHKLRANADLEEEFVKNLCEKLDVAYVASSPKEKIQKHSEEAFRQARMQFFKEKALAKNLKVIAQGHHLGDVVESILMRLMRGASLEGLVAPRAVSKHGELTFVRPFLSIKKSQITESLKSVNQAWCEDESNAENDYLRNKVRNQILPLLRQVCDRDFDEMAHLSKTFLTEQQEFFEGFSAQEFAKAKQGDDAIFLDSKHRALLRALVSKFLYAKKIEFNLKTLNNLLDKVEINESLKLSTKNGFLEFKDKTLRYFENKQAEAAFCQELNLGENILPNGSLLTLEKLSLGEDALDFVKQNSNLKTCVFMDFSKLKFPLYARNRRQGDAIEYMGLRGKKSLQDIFVDKKVPRQMRDKIAIITDTQGTLLWVEGTPPSKKVLIKGKSDVIRLTFVAK